MLRHGGRDEKSGIAGSDERTDSEKPGKIPGSCADPCGRIGTVASSSARISVYIDGIADGKGAVSKIGGFLTARGAENGILLALALCALGYCAAVLLKGVVSAVNIQAGNMEKPSVCIEMNARIWFPAGWNTTASFPA